MIANSKTGVPVAPWTVVMSTVFLASQRDVRDVLLSRLEQAIWFWELRGNVLLDKDRTRFTQLIRDAGSVNVPSGVPPGSSSPANLSLGTLVEEMVSFDIATIGFIADMVKKIGRELTASKSVNAI